jgi:hypothetical protein
MLRLWAGTSWPIGRPPAGARAVEWVSAQPGHPTSYALLGTHTGSDIASVEHINERFDGSLAGEADDVRFGLLDEYRTAVQDVLSRDASIAPCLAACGLWGSSAIAFRAVALFMRDAADKLWDAPDHEIQDMWTRLLQKARQSP